MNLLKCNVIEQDHARKNLRSFETLINVDNVINFQRTYINKVYLTYTNGRNEIIDLEKPIEAVTTAGQLKGFFENIQNELKEKENELKELEEKKRQREIEREEKALKEQLQLNQIRLKEIESKKASE